MKVRDAEICLDCDEVYDSKLECCPGCGSCSSVYLSTWLQPLPTRDEINAEVRAASISRRLDNLLIEAQRLIRFDDDNDDLIGVAI